MYPENIETPPVRRERGMATGTWAWRAGVTWCHASRDSSSVREWNASSAGTVPITFAGLHAPCDPDGIVTGLGTMSRIKRPMLGVRSPRTAGRTLPGYEVAAMIGR